MGGIMKAPWTPEQVATAFGFQMFGKMHPYTCINRGDGKHQQIGPDLGMLIPTIDGWICPFCDYRQDWVHDVIFGWT